MHHKVRLRSSFSTTVAREARPSGHPCALFLGCMLPQDPTQRSAVQGIWVTQTAHPAIMLPTAVPITAGHVSWRGGYPTGPNSKTPSPLTRGGVIMLLAFLGPFPPDGAYNRWILPHCRPSSCPRRHLSPSPLGIWDDPGAAAAISDLGWPPQDS